MLAFIHETHDFNLMFSMLRGSEVVFFNLFF